ncbi:hypothetical protein [Megalodesulfovibrio paquesii]
MSKWLWLCLAAALLSGCAGAKTKAHEMAEAAVYKPVEYQNANMTGPPVVVLPGTFNTRSAAYVHKYCKNSLCDFAELELSKANFTVLENADQQPLFEEIALAATMSDADALRLFRKSSLPTARYLMAFDVLKAEPIAWEAKGGDGQILGAIVELGILLATRGDDSGLGKSANAAISSIKAYDYNTTWQVTLGYKVIDPDTGTIVHSGSVEEKQVAQDELNAALGISEKTTSAFTVDSLVQRLIQKAVADLDKTIKPMAGPAVANAEPSGKAGKKPSKAEERKQQALAKEYAKKVAERKMEQDKDNALLTLKAYDFAWSNMDGPAMLALADPGIKDVMTRAYVLTYNQVNENNPNWRQKLTFDISRLSYEVAEYSPERCKIKRMGECVSTMKKGKTTEEGKFDTTDEFDLVKADGRWLIANSNGLAKEKEAQAKEDAAKPQPKFKPAAKKKKAKDNEDE